MGMKHTTLVCCKCSRWRPDYYFFCHILNNCPSKHIMIILLQSQPRKLMEDWVFVWHGWRPPTPLNESNGPHEWQKDSCYTSWHVKNSNDACFTQWGKDMPNKHHPSQFQHDLHDFINMLIYDESFRFDCLEFIMCVICLCELFVRPSWPGLPFNLNEIFLEK